MDELHLWVFPFVAGSGENLLPGVTTHLDLTAVTEVGNGVVVLTYAPKSQPYGWGISPSRARPMGFAAGRSLRDGGTAHTT